MPLDQVSKHTGLRRLALPDAHLEEVAPDTLATAFTRCQALL